MLIISGIKKILQFIIKVVKKMSNKIICNGEEYAGSIVNDAGVGEYTTNNKKKNPIGNNAEIFNSYGGTEQRWDGTIIEYGNIATGEYSHAEGFRTTASGNYSHAEGLQSIASGHEAHAEAYSTASGDYSHAEGSGTTASGDSGSHAEGNGTLASAPAAHAEGSSTQATAGDAHAEGCQTIASGYHAHTEGVNTKAGDSASHAEGEGSWAGSREGYNCVAAHAEGKDTRAWSNYTHAEGWRSQALATTSHAEGYQTIASGAYAHSEGWETEAYGAAAHSGGHYTLAKGVNSIAIGENTVASCQDQIALGKFNILDEDSNGYANNKYVIIVGNGSPDTSSGNFTYNGKTFQRIARNRTYQEGDWIYYTYNNNQIWNNQGLNTYSIWQAKQAVSGSNGPYPFPDWRDNGQTQSSMQYWEPVEGTPVEEMVSHRANTATLSWKETLVCGKANQVTDVSNSAVFGDNNIVETNYSLVSGQSNSVTQGAYGVLVSGSNNSFAGSTNYSRISGSYNTITNGADNSSIDGSYNSILYGANNSSIQGSHNQVGSDNSHAEGQYNNILGGASYSHIEGKGDSGVATSSLSNYTIQGCTIDGLDNYWSGLTMPTNLTSVISSGSGCHAEGLSVFIHGSDYCHIEGMSIIDNTNNKIYRQSIYNGNKGTHMEGGGNYSHDRVLCAHIEGQKNILNGDNGNDNTVYCEAVHIEGSENVINNCSNTHVEGANNTITTGSTHAHVEGANNIIASGSTYAHVEGHLGGAYSGASACHVEGGAKTVPALTSLNVIDNFIFDNITKFKIGDTEIGNRVIGTGSGMHAEGLGCIVQYSNGAHIEGMTYVDNGTIYPNYISYANDASHVEGAGNRIDAGGGSYSHVEGLINLLNQGCSICHIEGKSNNINSGSTVAHAEGYNNLIHSGSYSHVEGQGNIINSSPCGHIEGGYNTMTNGSYCAHIEGNNNTIDQQSWSNNNGNIINASSANAHAEGRDNISIGAASHTQGIGNRTQGIAQTALGMYNDYDKTATSTNRKGTYAITVGNGSATPTQIAAYDNTATYSINDQVIYEGKAYKCIIAITEAEEFDSTKWTELNIELINNEEITRSNAMTLTWDGYLDVSGGFSVNGIAVQPGGNGDIANPNISDAYSSSATYNVGDYCIYQDTLYKCTVATQDQQVNSQFIDNWQATTVGEELKAIIGRVAALETALNGYNFTDN